MSTEMVRHETGAMATVPQFDAGATIQAIVDKGITGESVAVLKDLMAMHRETQRESARAAYARAFAALRKECAPIAANNIIPTKDGGIKGRFASLDDILEQIEPLLVKHGFTMTFDQAKLDGGMTRVTCRVMHEQGHEAESGFTCREHASPQNSAAQNDGGTNTLAKRYAVCNMFGIRVNFDADARGEGDVVDGATAKALERRVGQLCGGDTAQMQRWLRLAGVATFADVTEAKAKVLAAALAEEERRRRNRPPADEPPPAPESDEPYAGDASPESPSIPQCPSDVSIWKMGMDERLAAMGLSPSRAAAKLQEKVGVYCSGSYLQLTAQQRAEIWAAAHRAKSAK